MSALSTISWSRGAAWLPVAAGLFLSALAAAPAAADDEPSGFVMDIGGVWNIAGQKSKLAGGDKLPGGVTLVPAQPGPKTFITVCLYSGAAETYKARATLPKQVESGWTSRLWSIVQGRFRGGIVHAVSRGDGIADGVARLDGDQLQLASLLKHLPSGTHQLRFNPLSAEKAAAEAAAPITLSFDWNPAQPESLDAKGLAPGLYQVHLLNKRTRQPTGAHATVLVATGTAFDEASSAFEQAVKVTRKWDETTRTKAASPFLTAYLEALAHPGAP
jgi:hypothetical protein